MKGRFSPDRFHVDLQGSVLLAFYSLSKVEFYPPLIDCSQKKSTSPSKRREHTYSVVNCVALTCPRSSLYGPLPRDISPVHLLIKHKFRGNSSSPFLSCIPRGVISTEFLTNGPLLFPSWAWSSTCNPSVKLYDIFPPPLFLLQDSILEEFLVRH